MLTPMIPEEFEMPVPRWLKTYPAGPYRFIDREFFIITYETDIEILRAIVPNVLEIVEPVVKFEFIRMPDSTGFGNYTESGQVIPVRYKGEEGTFTVSMYLDCEAPIAGGREIWGFPKKFAKPQLFVEDDVLIGLLDYGSIRVAIGTMGYKYYEMDKDQILESLKKPVFLLKNIPAPDGTPAICQLTKTYLTDIVVKGAWSGPAGLELHSHGLAQVAGLPIKKIKSAIHFITDLTLPFGEIAENFLAKKE